MSCTRWVDQSTSTPHVVQRVPVEAEHEPLGELHLPYGDVDSRPLDLILVEISGGPAPPEEQRVRFYVCKHCRLAYWEPV